MRKHEKRSAGARAIDLASSNAERRGTSAPGEGGRASTGGGSSASGAFTSPRKRTPACVVSFHWAAPALPGAPADLQAREVALAGPELGQDAHGEPDRVAGLGRLRELRGRLGLLFRGEVHPRAANVISGGPRRQLFLLLTSPGQIDLPRPCGCHKQF